MYYDNRGRVIQTKSQNHLSGGIEKEYVAYNFTGQPTGKKHVHSATGKATQTELYTYAYDHAGRLTTVKHKLNTDSIVTLAENTYDELGRLKTNKKNKQSALTSSYAYNIRSWMKSVASPLFSQTLYYNDTYAGNIPRYNGNISAMSWIVSGENKTRGYNFTYDNLSRLTGAGYLENGNANDRFNTSYAYDKHGNMTLLSRRGNTGTTTYGLIDNLSMTYAGNQLVKTEDTGSSVTLSQSMDFKNNANLATEYLYDKNGNLIKDYNKSITEISYNVLNLPQTLKISSATNTYTYAADGRKLKTVLGGSKTTDYCGNVIYENGLLKRILVDGGYIENGTYYFYLTDHLGNNRVIASAGGSIVQSNHYYPFGMSFAEGSATSQQPYKYNGKELDTERGLNLYDYSARLMDPALGRFNMVDPMAEKYYGISPYAYCADNPVKFIDPDGNQIIVPPYPIVPIPVAPMTYVPRTDYKKTGEAYRMFATDILNSAKNFVSNVITTSEMLGTMVVLSLNPEFNHQRQRDRRAKEGLDRNQANVAKSIEDNISGDMPNGDPAPKRAPQGIKAVIIGVGLAAEAVKEHVETTASGKTNTDKENKNKISDKEGSNTPLIFEDKKNIMLTPIKDILDENSKW
jgi:RHS repeat-associated protein